MKDNKIKILTTTYNSGKYFDLCMNSILSQKYNNFIWCIIDDCSIDNTFDKIPNKKNIIKMRNNIHNGGALPNLHNMYLNYCESDDISIVCDGDDWLVNKNVLSYINDFYNKYNCMMMYGQCRWYNPESQFKRFEEKGLAYPISQEQFKNLRNSLSWPFSHIRTFRAKAYHEIEKQDPNYDCLKDENGKMYTIGAGDFAVFLPVAEIVGYENIKYNDKVLYVYNRETKLNEDKVYSFDLQTKNHLEVNSKPKFKQIF